MRIDCYKAREWRWVDSQFTFYCRQTWHSPQETGASPKQALPFLLNYSTRQKREKRQKRAMTKLSSFMIGIVWTIIWKLQDKRQQKVKLKIVQWKLHLAPTKKRKLFIKNVIFIHRYQRSMCSLFSIFFRATMQAQTYVKIGVLASQWTKICPSLFECAENTFFHIFVIFKL